MTRILLLALLGFSLCFLHRLDGSTILQSADIVSGFPPADANDPILAGGFSPVDLNDPKVVAVGKFVVDQHNKDTKPILEFVKVVTAESQVVARIIYNMTIAAKDANLLNNYRALVSVDLIKGGIVLLTIIGFLSCFLHLDIYTALHSAENVSGFPPK
ncbi:hypothetical protein L6452_18339 [Arctium lappa]|uniref:Uncharacterized protein n=1 Tax=Arctium lappa TaxID=4217 RepID=A0ACB9C5T0_ARCLA|nr:hypothetical protein L6452_18339 [Arctium lappa]